MDQTDLLLLRELEKGLGLTQEPFEEIGSTIGISADEVLTRIRRLQAEGVIRKIRARINQRDIGFSANALVAWRIPPQWDRYHDLAAQPGVTHCYLRQPVPGRWEYTLYTVHHKRSRDEVYEEVKQIAEEMGLDDYIVLFSTAELKRVPAARIDLRGEDVT